MDQILNTLPVNKLAAIVVSKYKSEVIFKPSPTISSMTPLPTRQFRGIKEHDLTGKKCGRYTVIGCSLWESKNKTETARWVVRCSCGRYQILRSRTIKKNDPNLACFQCEKTIYLSKK